MKDRLTTSSYCFILAANFLLYFGFWLLIPVLPFYLSEFFQAGNSTIGIVLSCYTVAALCIRPFSGYLLDTFARKPLYLFAYFIFMMMFGGYLIAGSLTLFIMFRIIHGVSFGMVTVGGNTVVIDIMPSSRRGEGLGYYGLTNNTAMSIGPMFGLFLHDAGVSFATIFCYAFGACILGFLSASLVKTPYKPPVKREPISLDRFILLKGMPAGLSLLLLSIPYGMTTNYVAMYARQIGLHTQTGFFFTFMAVGMAISRIFSGKLVDRGRITQVIAAGLYLVVFSFFLLAGCVYLIQWSDTALRDASRVYPEDIEQLEQRIDFLDSTLPPLRNFILPGGTTSSAQAHVCRTVCRRAERRICELHATHPVDLLLLRYINRLSDYLFILSRQCNISERKEEIYWDKGCK